MFPPMTESTAAGKWIACMNYLQQNLPNQEYDTWFAPLQFVALTGHTLTISTPNKFVGDYIGKNYRDLMRAALLQMFDAETTLVWQDAESIAEMQRLEEERQRILAKQQGKSAAPPQPPLSPRLIPDYTFSTFIEGDSNKLPRTIGLSIAEHPGRTTFNPFFIYGPSGSGKTHLINAIGVRCKEIYPQKRVLYVSARLFQVQYTDAVRQNTVNDFIHFYQTIDVLIVDDIQEWAAATKTLDTFFHVFDHLFRCGKQIILAADRPPVDLVGVKDRLLTRFSCGMIAELHKPNVQLCIDILNTKCRRDGLKFPADVIQFIAETANSSVRELEGVVNSLMAYSIVYNSDIDMRLAERVIKRAVKVDNRPLTIDDIIEKVCAHYNVTQPNVMSRSRKREFVIARQLSMYFAQKYTKMPASRIGQLVGGRDHSTVIHSCNTIDQRMKVDKAFVEEVTSIENSFKLKQ